MTFFMRRVVRAGEGHGALLLGTREHAEDRALLDIEDVQAVVTVGDEVDCNPPQHLKHFIFRIRPSGKQPLITFFTDINGMLHRELRKGSVLVHCDGLTRVFSLPERSGLHRFPHQCLQDGLRDGC
jgi:hypothetical protein